MDEAEFIRMLDIAAAKVDEAANIFVPVHEVFQQMQKAGFTRREACDILGVWMSRASEK